MQALDDAMIARMLEAAAVVGRERPAEEAARISTAVTTVATAARGRYRLDDASGLELADSAMELLDAEDDGLDGDVGEQG